MKILQCIKSVTMIYFYAITKNDKVAGCSRSSVDLNHHLIPPWNKPFTIIRRPDSGKSLKTERAPANPGETTVYMEIL